MTYTLGDHFTCGKLLRFSFPSIMGMIFTSFYTIVDGIFVSNVAGESAFAALNLIWPAVGILQSFGFMIGSGGAALISKTMGEGDQQKANEIFSMLVVFEAVLGIIVSMAALLFLRPLSLMLGADNQLIDDCMIYGGILMAMIPFVYWCSSFQSFFLIAARPRLGLLITLTGGLMNIFLDYLFMVPFHMGIAGAALATGLNWAATGILPLLYFIRPNPTPLQLIRFSWNGSALKQTLLNGSSEMVANLSISLVSVLYNLELMTYIGSAGVNAYGVIQYMTFLFLSVFFGYNMAVTPVIGFQFGAENHQELRSLLKKSLFLTAAASVFLTVSAEILAPALSMVFVSYSKSLMELTIHAIHIYSICFLLSGFNIFVSGFFTGLNNGPVSAAISFLRTFLFQTGCILLLPHWFGVEGIWWATTVSEFLAAGISLWFLAARKKQYHY